MYEKLLKELSALRGRTLVSAHSLADADAIASAVSLSQLIPGAVIAFPDKPAGHARRIMADLNIELRIMREGELAGFDNVVLSDVSTLDLLGNLRQEFAAFAKNKSKKFITVDHHLHSRRVPGAKHHVFSERSSCSEVILELFRRSHRRLSNSTALLLAVGILNDTAFIRTADWRTFVDLGELLKQLSRVGWTYKRLLALALPKPELSQRIAILRGLASARFFELSAVGEDGSKKPLLVAIAFASNMELPCAGALVDSGADYAFVGSKAEGRISAVRSQSLEGAKIGKIMESAGKALRGNGGGHDTVGGASGSPQLIEEGLNACLQALESFYRSKARQLK